jgi:hypothetical protein
MTSLSREVDAAIGEATRRGRTNAAPCPPWKASEGRVASSWMSVARRLAPCVSALKAKRASVSAKGQQIETEAAPIRCGCRIQRDGQRDCRSRAYPGVNVRGPLRSRPRLRRDGDPKLDTGSRPHQPSGKGVARMFGLFDGIKYRNEVRFTLS